MADPREWGAAARPADREPWSEDTRGPGGPNAPTRRVARVVVVWLPDLVSSFRSRRGWGCGGARCRRWLALAAAVGGWRARRRRRADGVRVCQMTCFLLFVAHILGCLWHWLTIIDGEDESATHWINVAGLAVREPTAESGRRRRPGAGIGACAAAARSKQRGGAYRQRTGGGGRSARAAKRPTAAALPRERRWRRHRGGRRRRRGGRRRRR